MLNIEEKSALIKPKDILPTIPAVAPTTDAS